MTEDERRRAAGVLVTAADEWHDRPVTMAAVLSDPDYALYVFRRARSHVHPLWTGEGTTPDEPFRGSGPAWEQVQAAARVLELPETEPAPARDAAPPVEEEP